MTLAEPLNGLEFGRMMGDKGPVVRSQEPREDQEGSNIPIVKVEKTRYYKCEQYCMVFMQFDSMQMCC